MENCRDHIIVDRTPKCRPKLSGEGIENSWFFEKNYYRQLSLDKKKGKKFKKTSPRGHIKRQPYHKAGWYVS